MWRAAIPDDDSAVARLYLTLNEEDPGIALPDPARMQRTLTVFRRTPDRGRCVVLDVGGNVDGYALLVPYWSNEIGGLVCCIDEMCVAPPARGHRRGSELLELLATGALGWRETVALQLEVSPLNRRARALYERHGFRQVRNATLVRMLTTQA